MSGRPVKLAGAVPGRRQSGPGWAWWAMRLPGGLLFVGIGTVLLAVPGRSERGGYALLFGALLLSLGLVTVVAVVLEVRWRHRRPGARLGRTADGQPVTVVPRAPWAPAVLAWVLASLTLPILAGGGLALLRGNAVLAGASLLFGLWLARYLVPLVALRPDSGGVTLSPDGLMHSREGTSWYVAWDDVLGVAPGAVTGVVLLPGAQVRRRRSAVLGRRTLGSAQEGVLAIDTALLAATPEALATLVRTCALRPERRPDLGTPSSLSWPDEPGW